MTRRTPRPEAFTITELLVVIAVIVLLVAIAVPAFSSLIASSERSLAENQFRVGVSAARDAAIQSESSGDAAAVFLFLNGRTVILPCVAVGQVADLKNLGGSPTDPDNIVMRDIFVPIATIEPVQLPRGWSVRAYAADGTCYDAGAPAPNYSERWYESYDGAGAALSGFGGWVFPENGYFVPTSNGVQASREGSRRQTFIVRFKGGTGELVPAGGATALVFAPLAETGFRTGAVYSTFRADQLRMGAPPNMSLAPSQAAWVRSVLAYRPDIDPPAAPVTDPNRIRRQLLGDQSPDTVMVRPVTELALYQESRLGAGLRVQRLNSKTGTLYADPAATPSVPRLDVNLLTPSPLEQEMSEWITEWVEGRYTFPPNSTRQEDLVPSDARIYTLQRYLGQVQEITP
jgi:type II secretory pathway pseudopilin PulG